jgi:hypothetical protein
MSNHPVAPAVTKSSKGRAKPIAKSTKLEPKAAAPKEIIAPSCGKSAMDFAVKQLAVPDANAQPQQPQQPQQAAQQPQEATHVPDPVDPTFGGITETPEFKQALQFALQKQTKGSQAQAKGKLPKVARDTNKGITRPSPGTITRRVWDAADEISAKLATSAPISLVKAVLPMVNDHTVKTQYARWRLYNGITGRIALPATLINATEQAATVATEQAVTEQPASDPAPTEQPATDAPEALL